MSAAPDADEAPPPAVPVADLGELDRALRPNGPALADVLKRLRPADVGRDLQRRTPDAGKRVLEAMDDRRASAALRAAHPSVAARAIAMLDPARSGALLARIPTDDRVKIVSFLTEPDRARLDSGLDAQDRAFLERTLKLPEGTVARVMSPHMWAVERTATIGHALDLLKESGGQIEVAPNLYVTDEGKLVGVIALRDVAVAPRETVVETTMTHDPIAVRPEAGIADAAEIIQTHDFLSLPVIDEKGRLLGAVRVDDLLDSAIERVGAGALNQGGIAGKVAAREPYFVISQWKVVRSRVTWLILLFVAETLTGTVLRAFEDELAAVVALSFFVPLIIGTGGNAGSQTVSTIIRALALGEVRTSDVGRVVLREAITGLMLGILLATVAFFRAQMWGVGADLGLCVAITILVVCVWANLVGSVIPIAAHALKIDPTVVSGPMITTLVDASGLFIYLTVAHYTVAALAGT
jgi:magnesium transporter